MSLYVIRWIPLREAHRFVACHHRHHAPAQGGIVALGIFCNDALVGCGIIGRPVARMHGRDVCEITRTCLLEELECGSSMLLGKLRRLAQALGFVRMVTYTLASERGVSLKAAGWTQDDLLMAGGKWDRPSLRRAKPNYPPVRKIRWWRDTGLQGELPWS